MVESEHEVRHVNWNEVFSFSHIFKSFKMAVHPSKLLLALAAIVLIFVGGWVLDGLWSLTGQYTHPNEIQAYFVGPGVGFDELKAKWQKDRPENISRLWVESHRQRYHLSEYQRIFSEIGGSGKEFIDEFRKRLNKLNDKPYEAPDSKSIETVLNDAKDDWPGALDDAGDVFKGECRRIEDLIDESRDAAEERVKKITDKTKQAKATERLDEDSQLARQALARRKRDFARETRKIRGNDIFRSLLDYEADCIRNAITAVRFGNFTGGIRQYQDIVNAKATQPVVVTADTLRGYPTPRPADDPPGFVFWALAGVWGIKWLIVEHWLYATIFLLFSLGVWAVFGGAIHRIAALHFAREEKISMAQALKFSSGKFFSFVTAPLLPLAFIFIAGGLLALGGFATGTWGGGILMGILFFLAVLLGLAIAFLLIGLVSGAGLMYPTIAVEGSDSFDAISRSVSYVFNKPWRAGLYGLIALVYGVITYVFVRLFAYLALAATHTFVSWGVFGGGQTLGAEADKLDVLWTAPTFDCLFGRFSWSAMSGAEQVGAFLIGIWIFLVAATVAAYMLSYLASSTTVIYYLLRRKVDATDLDDVYVEEAEEPATQAEPAEAETPPAEPTSEDEKTDEKTD